MSDGDNAASYEEVRQINKLNSSQVSDDVLDQHLDQAEAEVESLAKSSFLKDATPSFTNILINTKDLRYSKLGAVLYLLDFNYGIVQSITSAEYRSSEDASWETLTDGQNDDYTFDPYTSSITFTQGFSIDGNQNLRLSGTYGYKFTALPKKWKYLIALIAALQGIIYSSGGSYNSVDSHNVGGITINKGQYSQNLKSEYSNVLNKIESHMKAHGIKSERTSVDII